MKPPDLGPLVEAHRARVAATKKLREVVEALPPEYIEAYKALASGREGFIERALSGVRLPPKVEAAWDRLREALK